MGQQVWLEEGVEASGAPKHGYTGGPDSPLNAYRDCTPESDLELFAKREAHRDGPA